MTDDGYTRESTVALIERLVEELQNGGHQWGNTTALDYLDALGGCLAAAAGYYRNNFDIELPDNPWRVISDALEAARTYE